MKAIFRKTKKFVYGLTNLEKIVDCVTYKILIDHVYSGKKTTRTGGKTVDPNNVRFLAAIDFENGSYVIKRNIKTKTEAKNILKSVMFEIKKETTKNSIKSVLVKMSKQKQSEN